MTTSRAARPLEQAVLDALDGQLCPPVYDRAALRRSIVHIGVGGFHRAHLATYVDELCRSGRTDWSIVGAGVLAQDRTMAAALSDQDYLYTLITRGPESTDVRVIGSLVDFVCTHGAADGEPSDPTSLVAVIADPATQIVSLTVTEGGYPIDDVSGEYLPESPVAGTESAFGIIAAALDLRRQHGGGGITVLSCDNIVSNGKAARAATLGEASLLSPELAEWVGFNCTFPNSMVDRITPATSDADRRWLKDHHGLADRWPVVTEPFRQWVVEDNFAGDRLPLEDLDVLATEDVEPYEFMKLRLLNAAHSCLAYLAALLQIETVDAALAHPGLRAYVRAFLECEARPVLDEVPGVDLDEYIDSLIERFSNPAIGDQISRLCLDGTAKFPKFLLPTVRAQLAVGGNIALSALALAGWCQYLTGPAASLSSDPLLDEAVEFAHRSTGEPAAFLQLAKVFGPDLARSEHLTEAFSASLDVLRSSGVTSAIEASLGGVASSHDGSNG